ncbi:hypothetical protein FBU30_006925 [Linnemannia zychae]|nr:hypothetical protein FBU30_006925 [Linnemannia zychae]
MKFSIAAAAVVALAATSQVAAVVPIPVKECTRSYVVEPGTPDCVAFATKFGITFKDLLAWNTKLREDCANLDVGEPLCVSITPGNCCLRENPHGAVVPQPGVPPQPSLWDPTPSLKGGNSSVVSPPPAASSTVANVPVAPSSSAGAKPTSAASGPTTTAAAGAGATPNVKANNTNAAASNKGSIILGAAGLILSAFYMF